MQIRTTLRLIVAAAMSKIHDLRASAHACLVCGRLADVDPELHHARYGHRSRYRDDDGTVRVWFAGRWAEKLNGGIDAVYPPENNDPGPDAPHDPDGN